MLPVPFEVKGGIQMKPFLKVTLNPNGYGLLVGEEGMHQFYPSPIKTNLIEELGFSTNGDCTFFITSEIHTRGCQ